LGTISQPHFNDTIPSLLLKSTPQSDLVNTPTIMRF
jgi:hypothetical protein